MKKPPGMITPAMVFGKTPQYIIDSHYHDMLETLKTGDAEKISFLLACVNYIKAKDGYDYIDFAAANLVMSGWLTKNAKNEYIVKVAV